MSTPIVRTDKSVFDRIRDAILNRGDPDHKEKPTGPGAPTPG
ncbi:MULTISPECIES: hypothetical protein [Haloferax]|nr:hypothetical protein [Haloferax mediterranei]MDX5989195.1 hypothetical protein [Haloferax mediterranei ATCC 33500]